MTGIRKGGNLGPVALLRLAAKKGGPGVDTNAANGKTPAAQSTIEFPQRPTLDDVISKRIIFEVGDTRFFFKELPKVIHTNHDGDERSTVPFFSPDGQWVAFSAGGKLKKISVDGGAVTALCDAPSFRGGAWGEDHYIIATFTSGSSVLSRIPDAGGAPQTLTELAPGEATHRWPQILPGGKAVLFTASASATGFDGANIEVLSLKDRRRKTLQRGGTFGRYLPTSNGATSHMAARLRCVAATTLISTRVL